MSNEVNSESQHPTSHYSVQPKKQTKMDTITMGDMALEKATRLHRKTPKEGTL